MRLRLNRRRARHTAVSVRQFALHEVLGHALQCATWSHRCAARGVPWVRLLTIHALNAVAIEGLAETLPLLAAPNDAALETRVRLDHYLHLVRAELHMAVNAGVSHVDCVTHARSRVPFWSDEEIGDLLTDRAVDPQLRSYLWAYPAGVDWFVSLAEAGAATAERVLVACYEDTLAPNDLETLWPHGPIIGGPGCGPTALGPVSGA